MFPNQRNKSGRYTFFNLLSFAFCALMVDGGTDSLIPGPLCRVWLDFCSCCTAHSVVTDLLLGFILVSYSS